MDRAQILAIEEELWFGGAPAYRRHLADEALVVVPGAALDREQTIAAIEQSPRWDELERHDERFLALGSERMLVHYQAEARRGASEPYQALVSSAYALLDGRPRLVFHQQTPLTP